MKYDNKKKYKKYVLAGMRVLFTVNEVTMNRCGKVGHVCIAIFSNKVIIKEICYSKLSKNLFKYGFIF
jgi:hypothetical protein